MLYSVAEPIIFEDPVETTGCTMDRTGHMLARFYGYTSLNELAFDLPDNAKVLDMGAGLSDLGHQVARERPDVTWVNFDARYDSDEYPSDEQKAIAQMKATAPNNLTYVGGNVLDLPCQIRVQKYHRIFSYYMFPYVIDYFGKAVATRTMKSTLELLDTTGQFSTGPNRYSDYAWTVIVAEYPQLGELAADMIKRYTESWEDSDKRREAESIQLK